MWRLSGALVMVNGAACAPPTQDGPVVVDGGVSGIDAGGDVVGPEPATVMATDQADYTAPADRAVAGFTYANVRDVKTTLQAVDVRGSALAEVDVVVQSGPVTAPVVLFRGQTDDQGALKLSFTGRPADGAITVIAGRALFNQVQQDMTEAQLGGQAVALQFSPEVYSEVEPPIQ